MISLLMVNVWSQLFKKKPPLHKLQMPLPLCLHVKYKAQAAQVSNFNDSRFMNHEEQIINQY